MTDTITQECIDLCRDDKEHIMLVLSTSGKGNERGCITHFLKSEMQCSSAVEMVSLLATGIAQLTALAIEQGIIAKGNKAIDDFLSDLTGNTRATLASEVFASDFRKYYGEASHE